MSKCASCEKEAHENMEICEECLVSAVTNSLANFGEPDYLYCGHCGEKMSKIEFLEHSEFCRIANKIMDEHRGLFARLAALEEAEKNNNA
jgi:hypothetical protein